MRILALTSLLGLGLVAIGCGGDNVMCGTGTHQDGDNCVADVEDMAGDMAGVKVSCGTNQQENTSHVCELTKSACKQGTVLSADNFSCQLNDNHGSLIAGPYEMDRLWFFLRYNNGGSLAALGDFTSLTATVPDTTEIYLWGQGGPGNTDPMKADKFGLHAPLPTFWDSNYANPGKTALAQQSVVTVGDWKACHLSYSIYSNPPRTDMKKWYRVVVDAAGCPPDTTFGLWFQWSDTADTDGRILSTPAGGVPNMMLVLADGTGHWERDVDPNVWFKYGVALDGGTHGATVTPATGRVPNQSATASFFLGAFVHNDGQSNGNAGWCMSDPTVNTVCGQTDMIGGGPYGAGPNMTPGPHVPAYIYQPGKVGLEAFPAFSGGVPGGIANAVNLSLLQPY